MSYMPEEPMHSSEKIVAEKLRSGEWSEGGRWIVAKAVQLLTDAVARQRDPLPLEDARRAAQVLNRHLQHDLSAAIAEAWEKAGLVDIVLQKYHVQALVDTGALDQAEALIRRALAQAAAPPPQSQASATTIAEETAELEGLHARVLKDRFVRASAGGAEREARKALLVAARDHYAAQYAANEGNYWPGVNAMALQARYEHDFGRPGISAARERAQLLKRDLGKRTNKHYQRYLSLGKQREQLLRRNRSTAKWDEEHLHWLKEDEHLHWMFASLSETFLALNRRDEAELWLYRFVSARNTRPSDLHSYLRHLEEIWQADRTRLDLNCASRLAFILWRQIEVRTRSLSLTPESSQALRADEMLLERNFSGVSLFSVQVVRNMLQTCESIGGVCNESFARKGTGFLLDRRQLWPQDPPGLVFVTSAHVLSETESGALRPSEAIVTFEMDARRQLALRGFRVAEVLFYSPPAEDVGQRRHDYEELDITVVTLADLPADATGLQIELDLPKPPNQSRAYVVGHPQGNELRISLHDSRLLDYDDVPRLIHYRTPTEHGSSGSPVFNANWKVIGIHRASSHTAKRLDDRGTYEANEGIALAALCRKLEEIRKT